MTGQYGRISTPADDRQHPIYRVGDLLDIVIRRAMVVDVGTRQRDLIVRLTGGGNCSDELRIPLGRPDVTVTTVQPADGPIRTGDIWADRFGDRWFAIASPASSAPPRMVAQSGGGTQSPEYLARHHSPLTLVHRDQEPEYDLAEDADRCGATGFGEPHAFVAITDAERQAAEDDCWELCGKPALDEIHHAPTCGSCGADTWREGGEVAHKRDCPYLAAAFDEKGGSDR